ncbi:hypothetical protein F4553_001667 [Allocatelliglobosispora scoriae]|uniref:Uncharacterized protein n=1 Tax=Allocatelliglobosispora scoriae TaxID=643052 RepID=A0A841BLQ4_9ACTN|nr:hypothetical protein [Allocatelliglobosispora scoriae]MBB5868288.1 hypothetical protein [Allocatelliglobosispora scoriae]
MLRIKAMLAAVVIVFAGLAVSPASAHAAVEANCYWYSGQWGRNSNCDNQNFFYASACELEGPKDWGLSVNIGLNVIVYLDYVWGNGGCRSARARMTIYGPVPPGSNCYVKIARDSDNKTLYTSERYPGDSDEYQYTNILYDAGVTSYAWGYCSRPGYGTVSGRTASK